MKQSENKIIDLAYRFLDEACESNRYRESEIMQGIDGEKEHAKTVLSWVEKLTRNPSFSLKIAALFHDIDRVVTPGVGAGFKGDRKSVEYQEHKKAHAKRSAGFICPLLLKSGVDSKFAKRIDFLISHHDDTGVEVEEFKDTDLDMLVAADSLAFFTTIAQKLFEAEGEERVKDKMRFMVEKMPLPARTILHSQRLENKVFEKLKNTVIEEFHKNETQHTRKTL